MGMPLSQSDLAAGVPPTANIVQRIPGPGGKGELLLGADGGIFAIGGAEFSGSVPGLADDSLRGQHQFTTGGLTLGPNGGYVETDTGGHNYAYGTAPVPNVEPGHQLAGAITPDPLAGDAAFQAFLRTSGHENRVEAANTAREVGMNNESLRTTLDNLRYHEQLAAYQASGRMQARGLGSSSQNLNDQLISNRGYGEKITGETAANTATNVGLTNKLATDIAGRAGQSGEKALTAGQQKEYDTGNEALLKEFPLAAGSAGSLGTDTGAAI